MTEKKIPVILDVDTGVDDALALILALGSDRLDVKAVTTCFGNCSLEHATENTLRLLEYIGRTDVPVAMGAEHSLLRGFTEQELPMHGRVDTIGNVVLPPCSRMKVSELTAVDLIARTVAESDEPVWLVPVAPMTNIAAFLHCCPDLKEKIAGIAFMGGAAYTGNFSPASEANIWNDVEAAAMVFRAGIPMLMCGLEVTFKSYCTPEDAEAMAGTGGPIGKFARDCQQPYLDYSLNTIGRPGCAMHDGVPVAWLIDPDKVKTRPAFGEVDVWGSATWGATNIDFDGRISGRDCNMLVATDIDRKWYINEYIKAIRTLEAAL